MKGKRVLKKFYYFQIMFCDLGDHMKKDKVKLIVNIISELFESTNAIVLPSIQTILKEIGNKYISLLSEDIEGLVKIAMNYEEKNTEEYNLEDAVKWFKYNMSALHNPGSKGCILKSEDDKNEIIELHHCFLNKNNKPLINNNSPHLLVKTLSLDPDLLNQFGDKNMILLQ